MAETSTTPARTSRRHVLKILALGGATAVAWKAGLLGRWRSRVATRTRVLMGTTVNLTVLGDDQEAVDTAVEATLERMSGLESLLSRYRPESQVWRLNASGRLTDASDALLQVVGLARDVSELGDGAFDITIQPVLDLYREQGGRETDLPSGAAIEHALESVSYRGLHVAGRELFLKQPGGRITLDGIGKGYVVDEGVAELKRHGLENVFVEAGGDLMASGEKDGGAPWRVGIRNPRGSLSIDARIDARNRAVATSGDYMQPFTSNFAQHHILDPRTGRSSPELASSTVVAPTAAMADALATLTMVLGPLRGRELLEELPGCEGYFVSKQLEIVKTEGFVLS